MDRFWHTDRKSSWPSDSTGGSVQMWMKYTGQPLAKDSQLYVGAEAAICHGPTECPHIASCICWHTEITSIAPQFLIYSPLCAYPDCGIDLIHSKHFITWSDEMLASPQTQPLHRALTMPPISTAKRFHFPSQSSCYCSLKQSSISWAAKSDKPTEN